MIIRNLRINGLEQANGMIEACGERQLLMDCILTYVDILISNQCLKGTYQNCIFENCLIDFEEDGAEKDIFKQCIFKNCRMVKRRNDAFEECLIEENCKFVDERESLLKVPDVKQPLTK